MPRNKKFTDKQVAKKWPPGRYCDSEGLYLRVANTKRRTKSWVFQYVSPVTGKVRQMGLGSYGKGPDKLSLADARAKATEHRRLVSQKLDPMVEREQAAVLEQVAAAKSKTFGECASEYIETHKAGWTNPAHIAQWHSTFNETKRGKLTFPAYTAVLNDVPVSEINTELVLSCLKPIWATKTESATRVQSRIATVLDWAKAKELRVGDNPAVWRGHLAKLLPRPSKVKKVKHQRSMHYRDVHGFMQKLRLRPGVSARALEFLILTATRTGAVINATWDEIDLSQRLWTVQPRRVGAKIVDDEARTTILTDRAIAILKELPREENNSHVFIGGKEGSGLSDMALLELMKELEPDPKNPAKPMYVTHGFRATFKTWCSDKTNHPSAVTEAALWHGLPSKLLEAYDRSEMTEKRQRLMREWAAFCERPPVSDDNVTHMRRSAK